MTTFSFFSNYKQIVGRLNRQGQLQPVTVYEVIVNVDIDRNRSCNLKKKEKLFLTVLDGIVPSDRRVDSQFTKKQKFIAIFEEHIQRDIDYRQKRNDFLSSHEVIEQPGEESNDEEEIEEASVNGEDPVLSSLNNTSLQRHEISLSMKYPYWKLFKRLNWVALGNSDYNIRLITNRLCRLQTSISECRNGISWVELYNRKIEDSESISQCSQKTQSDLLQIKQKYQKEPPPISEDNRITKPDVVIDCLDFQRWYHNDDQVRLLFERLKSEQKVPGLQMTQMTDSERKTDQLERKPRRMEHSYLATPALDISPAGSYITIFLRSVKLPTTRLSVPSELAKEYQWINTSLDLQQFADDINRDSRRREIYHPVFTPSYKRSSEATLDYTEAMVGLSTKRPWAKYIHFIVIREEEAEAYQKAYGKSHIIVELPKAMEIVQLILSNDNCQVINVLLLKDGKQVSVERGVGYARAFIQLFAKVAGFSWVWMIDDLVACFERFVIETGYSRPL